MIKRFRFVVPAGSPGGDRSGRAGPDTRPDARLDDRLDDRLDAWSSSTAATGSAPAGIRPVRAAVCPVLVEETPDAPYAGVGIEWFADRDHATRFLAWTATAEGRAAEALLASVVDLPASPVLLAEETVMRGADWLESRWETGSERLKHMALARRASGLTPEQFSAKWRTRAGTIGSSSGPAVTIPDGARGSAYIQNHPLSIDAGERPYDAVNEVYCEDRAALRRRIEWFAGNLTGGAEDDLISRSWFLAVREIVVAPLRE